MPKKERLEALTRVYNLVKSQDLPKPVLQAIMHEILQTSLNCGVYDKDKFMEYLEQSQKTSDMYIGYNDREAEEPPYFYGRFLSNCIKYDEE